MEIFLLYGVIIAAAGGVFSGVVASAKKRDPLIWGIAGAAFPILGLIAIAAMPVNDKPVTAATNNDHVLPTILLIVIGVIYLFGFAAIFFANLS